MSIHRTDENNNQEELVFFALDATECNKLHRSVLLRFTQHVPRRTCAWAFVLCISCVILVCVVLQGTSLSFLWSTKGALEKPAPGVFETVENGVSFMTNDDGSLESYRSRSTTILWRTTLAGKGLWGKPLIVGKFLYVNVRDGGIAALRAENGRVLWRTTLPNVSSSILGIDDEHIFVRFQRLRSFDGGIAALRRTTGALLWSFPCFRFSRFVETDGRAYVLNADGLLEVRKVSDGKPLWNVHVRAAITSLYTLKGVVYLQTSPGAVIAFRAANGFLLWQK